MLWHGQGMLVISIQVNEIYAQNLSRTLHMSILQLTLPSLLDNNDTSPFKHESVTSFMLDAHLQYQNYKILLK